MKSLVIGTRGSALALTQTRWVAAALQAAHPELLVVIRTFVTRGDATQANNVPLSSFGQKGIFVTELETALQSGEIDLAVHSMKDLAATLPDGLIVAAVPERESPADALAGATLNSLPAGARVGTGSVRRRALLHARRPDLNLLEIRGNVDTRLRKLDEGQYDAVCLAVAGLHRLGLPCRIAEVLDTSWFLPDPGQGALAIEARACDTFVLETLHAINDPAAATTTQAERAFLAAVGGSCQTPIGALATLDGDTLTLRVMLATGDTVRYGVETGPAATAVEIGRRAASNIGDKQLLHSL